MGRIMKDTSNILHHNLFQETRNFTSYENSKINLKIIPRKLKLSLDQRYIIHIYHYILLYIMYYYIILYIYIYIYTSDQYIQRILKEQLVSYSLSFSLIIRSISLSIDWIVLTATKTSTLFIVVLTWVENFSKT